MYFRMTQRCLPLALVAVFAVIQTVPAQEKPKKIEPLKIGAKAIDFKLKGVDEKMYTLKDFDDAEYLVFIFTANHCPTAQAYEERIIKLVNDYKGKGVQVVAISPNDPKALRLNEMGYTDVGDNFKDCQIRAEHMDFNFPYLYDGDTQATSMKYGPRATPHAFVFNKDRVLVYEGGIDDSEDPKEVKKHHLRNALDALLAGKEVPATSTPTFGCSIKWASKRGAVGSWMEKVKAEKVELTKIGPDELKELIENKTKKLRFVNIWATWCGPCRVEFPDLVEINLSYRHRDFEMVTVSIDQPDIEDKVLEFLKDHHASMSNYLFNSKSRSDLVEALGDHFKGAIPTSLLIMPGGEVIWTHLGTIDEIETRRQIVDVIGRTYHDKMKAPEKKETAQASYAHDQDDVWGRVKQ